MADDDLAGICIPMKMDTQGFGHAVLSADLAEREFVHRVDKFFPSLAVPLA